VIRVLRTSSLPEGVLLWVRPYKQGYVVYVAPELLSTTATARLRTPLWKDGPDVLMWR
jgi:hypothetical protein